MLNLKMITKEEDLTKLTGLDHDNLWNEGFDLDDWDVCFVSDRKLTEANAKWLVNRMKSYCCGFEEVEFNKKFYYLVYHS